jgi:hypothetical protein
MGGARCRGGAAGCPAVASRRCGLDRHPRTFIGRTGGDCGCHPASDRCRSRAGTDPQGVGLCRGADGDLARRPACPLPGTAPPARCDVHRGGPAGRPGGCIGVARARNVTLAGRAGHAGRSAVQGWARACIPRLALAVRRAMEPTRERTARDGARSHPRHLQGAGRHATRGTTPARLLLSCLALGPRGLGERTSIVRRTRGPATALARPRPQGRIVDGDCPGSASARG